MEQGERLTGRNAPDPEQIDAELLQRMERAFHRLRPRHRYILKMLRLEQLTYPEIGDRLGIGIEEVETRVAAALVALDRAMERGEHRPWWWRFL